MKFSQHALVRGLEFQNIFRKSTQKLRRSVVPKSRQNVTTTRLFAFLIMVLFVEVYRCAQVNKWIQLLLWTVGERFVTVTPVLYREKNCWWFVFHWFFRYHSCVPVSTDKELHMFSPILLCFAEDSCNAGIIYSCLWPNYKWFAFSAQSLYCVGYDVLWFVEFA